MSNKGVSELETCMDYFGVPGRFETFPPIRLKWHAAEKIQIFTTSSWMLKVSRSQNKIVEP